jgi:hypothetical protein
MTTVVNVKKKFLNERGIDNMLEWTKRPDTVYIGRCMQYVEGANGSKWKNPFSVEKYGRDKCLSMYEEYIRNDPVLFGSLSELKNKELGCWCKPEACHGDILIKLIEGTAPAVEEAVEAPVEAPVEGPVELCHSCSICGKTYKTKYTLSVHKHTHNHFAEGEGRARSGKRALLLARYRIQHAVAAVAAELPPGN